jgi:pyridoxine 5-phosphate synthase
LATLCVNIDHIATLRQARREDEPDPVQAARLAEKGGAIGITAHLREDRRHIQDADVVNLRKVVHTKLNLEMAATPEMLEFALRVKPDQVTLVPERRQELTTEGGLRLDAHLPRVQLAVDRLQAKGIPVSLFILPDKETLDIAARLGALYVELHTGSYSLACRAGKKVREELLRVAAGARYAQSLGLQVHAGHGLTYANVAPIASLPEIEDLNIGHNIIARASMVGLTQAVREMAAILRKAGPQPGRKGGKHG